MFTFVDAAVVPFTFAPNQSAGPVSIRMERERAGTVADAVIPETWLNQGW
jgi:hypothetical protein